MNSTSPFFSKFNKILKATAVKLSAEGNNDEYHKILEQVGPAPGQPWDQHDTMESFNFYLLYFINFSVQVSNKALTNTANPRFVSDGRKIGKLSSTFYNVRF